MKRFSVILGTLLLLLLLSSCESLGWGSGAFDFKNWSWNIVERVDEKPAEEVVENKEPQKIVESINEKTNTTVENKVVAPIKEEVNTVKEDINETISDVKEGTEDVINQVSNWFEVKEEEVKETVKDVKENVSEGVNTAVSTTKEVVETTSESLETAVSDVLNAMKNTTSQQNTVIVVPAKEETTVAETKPAETQTATEIAKESLPAEKVDSTGSSAVLIIILVAVGLIVLAIAYYCISIKRKSY